jgi:hypothetical protein
MANSHTQSPSEVMQQIKQNSSKWINEKGFLKDKFYWQAGYGAFSYAKSEVPKIINYIQSQEEHHRTRTFREEYLEVLKDFDIYFDPKYIFKDPG